MITEITYKIDRVIYGDGRIIYVVYALVSDFGGFFSREPTPRKVKRTISRWPDKSLAEAARDRLEQEWLGKQILSRAECL